MQSEKTSLYQVAERSYLDYIQPLMDFFTSIKIGFKRLDGAEIRQATKKYFCYWYVSSTADFLVLSLFYYKFNLFWNIYLYLN